MESWESFRKILVFPIWHSESGPMAASIIFLQASAQCAEIQLDSIWIIFSGLTMRGVMWNRFPIKNLLDWFACLSLLWRLVTWDSVSRDFNDHIIRPKANQIRPGFMSMPRVGEFYNHRSNFSFFSKYAFAWSKLSAFFSWVTLHTTYVSYQWD